MIDDDLVHPDVAEEFRRHELVFLAAIGGDVQPVGLAAFHGDVLHRHREVIAIGVAEHDLRQVGPALGEIDGGGGARQDASAPAAPVAASGEQLAAIEGLRSARGSSPDRCRASEFDAQIELELLAFVADQVEIAVALRRGAGDPIGIGGLEVGRLGDLAVEAGADIEGAALEMLEGKASIAGEIAQFAAEEDAGRDLARTARRRFPASIPSRCPPRRRSIPARRGC